MEILDIKISDFPSIDLVISDKDFNLMNNSAQLVYTLVLTIDGSTIFLMSNSYAEKIYGRK